MRLPYRSISSIQALPSIYTTFPPDYDSNQSTDTSGINSGTCFIREIEDGIEVVPFERSNALSAPILSPDHEEKEVYVLSQAEMNASEKPLPSLPKCIWNRMSIRKRIVALLGLQLLMLMMIGLSLMAAKSHTSSDQASAVRVATDDSPHANATNNIRRGIFALPVQLLQQQSSACLARTNESVAWQCTPGTIQLNILPAPVGDANATMVTIGSFSSSGSRLYGDQVPDIPLVRMQAVGDAATDDGIAYHFRTTYNRVVLLREDDFILRKERQAQSPGRQSVFLPGDSLWQCTFNETLIEGYIYVSKPIGTDVTNMVNVTTTIRLPTVPYVVRLIEKRMPNGKAPYCEKMMVESDGSLASSSERIMLDPSDPEAEAAASTSEVTKRERAQGRQQEEASNYCRCQWLVE